MSVQAFIAGIWRNLVGGSVCVAGNWRTVTQVRVANSGAWKHALSFAPPMTATVFPESAFGYSRGTPSAAVSSEIVTCTPSGGIAPYRYLVAILDSGTAIASPGNTASCSIGDNVDAGQSSTVSARFTVTDSVGTTATADFTAFLFNNLSL